MTNELTAKVSLRLARLLLGVLNGSPTGVTKGLSCVLCWVKFSSICINVGPNVSSSCIEKDNVHTINNFDIRLKNLIWWILLKRMQSKNRQQREEMYLQLKKITDLILIVKKNLEESRPDQQLRKTSGTHTKVVRRCESHGCQVASTGCIYVRQWQTLASVERAHHLCHGWHGALQFTRSLVEWECSTHSFSKPAHKNV